MSVTASRVTFESATRRTTPRTERRRWRMCDDRIDSRGTRNPERAGPLPGGRSLWTGHVDASHRGATGAPGRDPRAGGRRRRVGGGPRRGESDPSRESRPRRGLRRGGRHRTDPGTRLLGPSRLLVSDLPDARAAAEEAGGLPGFGKTALHDEETAAALRRACRPGAGGAGIGSARFRAASAVSARTIASSMHRSKSSPRRRRLFRRPLRRASGRSRPTPVSEASAGRSPGR